MKAKLLSAIGSTEPSTFNEICQGLGDYCPADKQEWREFFHELRSAEKEGLVTVERTGDTIDSVMLTESGVAYLNGQ